ncbi:MAG: hypothetical protein HY286_11755 [Planctomycetes bacterium]|nr:hypothetical protein [Planctomycetota bacterium]
MPPYIEQNLAWLIPAVVVFFILFFFSLKTIVNVGPTQIAILERRFLGKALATGRVFATTDEVGIQSGYLGPGLHFVLYPIVRVIKKENFVAVNSDELAVVTAIDGEPLPSDRIFAEDKAGGQHFNFQNPTAFLDSGGIRGKQLRFLTPGTYKIHPFLFDVDKIQKTVVPQGRIGIVTAADGAPLDQGQLLGHSIAGHDNFQKAEEFLRMGGQKGPQIDFLRPGTYNIFTDMFRVEIRDAISMRENEVGVVESKAGAPMPKGDVVARTPDVKEIQNFQNGQRYLDLGGTRGPQEVVLSPGQYYINPLLFDVVMKPQTVVKQGEVGVLISNIGKDPAELFEGDEPISKGTTDPEEARLAQRARQRHVVPEGYRGIQQTTLGPGKYNLNPLAYSVVIVPTTTRSVEWAANGTNNNFDPFVVVSHDGFEMRVEVRCQYRILPEHAPYVVSKLGSVEELERNVIHPQIDGIFRAQVSKSPAISYQQNRAVEQKAAEDAVRDDLSQYRVEVVSVMITNIHLPEALMKTTQEKNLAEVRQSMYEAQQAAEEKRIAFERKKAEADQQDALIKAETGITIAERHAKAKMKQGEGDADYTRKTGEAAAHVTELQGRAQGVAYHEQTAALGPGGLALVQVIDKIAEKGLRITPDIVAGGDGGGGIGGVITALLLQQMSQRDGGAKGGLGKIS